MKPALLKLHIAVFLWGFTGVLGKLISLNEAWLVWYRLIITIATLFIILLVNNKQHQLKISNRGGIRLIFIGALVGLHWLFFYGSIKYANVSVALVCLSSNALFTAFFEPVINKQKINVIEILLSLIGVAGIGLIFHFSPEFQKGIIWGIVSSVFTALFASVNKKYIHNQLPQTTMFWELVGALVVVSFIIPLFYNSTSFAWPKATDWIWLLLLSWVCTLVAMFISLQALKKLSAFTQSLTLNLEPIYGIILAFWVQKEHKDISSTFYIGLLLIFISVLLQMMRVVRPKSSIQT